MTNKLLEPIDPVSHLKPQRPVVTWVVIVVSAYVCLTYIFNALGAIFAVGAYPVAQVAPTVLLTVVIAVASAFVLFGTLRGTFRSRLPVSLYCWGMLIVYPAINVLRSYGLYLPGPRYTNSELPAAAMLEMARYVILLVLIIWVMFSGALRKYFSKPA
jgi:hypothetical protein